MGLRSALYTIARLMGDVNAVNKGKELTRPLPFLHLGLFFPLTKSGSITMITPPLPDD